MSPKGRPKGEYRSAQHEGSPVSPTGRAPEAHLERRGDRIHDRSHSNLRAAVAALALLGALCAGPAAARTLARIDAAAAVTQADPGAARAAVAALRGTAEDAQIDARYGVPTFLWGAQASATLKAQGVAPAAKAGLDHEAGARAYLRDLADLYRITPRRGRRAPPAQRLAPRQRRRDRAAARRDRRHRSVPRAVQRAARQRRRAGVDRRLRDGRARCVPQARAGIGRDRGGRRRGCAARFRIRAGRRGALRANRCRRRLCPPRAAGRRRRQSTARRSRTRRARSACGSAWAPTSCPRGTSRSPCATARTGVTSTTTRTWCRPSTGRCSSAGTRSRTRHSRTACSRSRRRRTCRCPAPAAAAASRIRPGRRTATSRPSSRRTS